MKRPGDFYSLAAASVNVASALVCHSLGNIHATAASSVAKTADLIKSMPVSSAIKNRCPSSGKPTIVKPVKGRIGCPEEGCWAWWNDASLARYPEHVRVSIDDAQNQEVLLDRDEHFRRDVLGYVEVVIPRRPIPSTTVPMLLQAGCVMQPDGAPIEVAAEHVPAAVLSPREPTMGEVKTKTFRCPSSGESIPTSHRGDCLIHCNDPRCIESWQFSSDERGRYPIHDSTGMEENRQRKSSTDFR